MKTRNDCEIACDCVKRANVVFHVGLCEEIFARKHTATHKKGVLCTAKKKGGGSARSQHSARCASKWRRPG